MNLLDLPLSHEDPIEALLGFHRRIERHLASLVRLPACIALDGMSAASAAAAGSLEAFFSTALPLHHEQEERHLLPLIESRLGAGTLRAQFRETRALLEGDHRAVDDAWRRVRKPLRAVAEGVPRDLPEDAIHYFRALYAVHIPAEEAAVHRVAAHCLQRRDRAQLAQRLGMDGRHRSVIERT